MIVLSKYSINPIQERKKMMYTYITFLFILALGISLMPIGSVMKEKTMIMIYISGAFFWLGFIGIFAILWKINRCRKNSYEFHQYVRNTKQFGLICFFQNKEAFVVDMIMFFSLIGFIITKLCISEIIVCFAFFAIFVFAFGMHCMLNGINYKYLKYNSNYKRESKRDE